MALVVLGTDPRHESEEMLDPPAPLPYISRHALSRVVDRVEIPTRCPHCDGWVELRLNSDVYKREYGKWPYVYLCLGCRAYVGLHPETDLPLGTLADEDLREDRKNAKDAFIGVLIKGFRRKRTPAYDWLATQMGIPRNECHFAMFDADRCKLAFDICEAEYDQIATRRVGVR